MFKWFKFQNEAYLVSIYAIQSLIIILKWTELTVKNVKTFKLAFFNNVQGFERYEKKLLTNPWDFCPDDRPIFIYLTGEQSIQLLKYEI